MMRSRIWLITLAGIMVFSQMATAQIFSPHHSFSFVVGEDSMLILSGGVHIEGKIDALSIPQESIPFDSAYFSYVEILYPDFARMLENLLTDRLRVYPMFVEYASTDVLTKVYLVNVNTKEVVDFSNVKLAFSNSSMMVGGANLTVQLNNYLDYAIYVTASAQLISQNETSFIAQLTDDESIILAGNTTDFIFASSSIMSSSSGSSGKIVVKNVQGNTLWSGSDNEWIAVAESNNLLITLNAPLMILPLQPGIAIDLEESENLPYLNELIEKASSSLPSEYDIPQIEGFSDIMSAISPILNGICALSGNSSVLIDGDNFRFNGMGAIRFNSCRYRTIHEQGNTLSRVSGDGKLIFLGDQVYSGVPTYDVNGFPVPLHPIFVWMLGIGIFILFRFALKKREDEEKPKKGWMERFPLEISEQRKRTIKWVSLGVHILLIVAVFVLFDFGLRDIAGISALSSSNILVAGALFSLQLLCMSIAYVSFALPSKLASYGVLEFMGIGKEGRGIGKSIGLIVMLFTGISYIPYVLNFIIIALKNMIPNLSGFVGL